MVWGYSLTALSVPFLPQPTECMVEEIRCLLNYSYLFMNRWVLVCSGRYNKTPQTGWCMNTRNLFLPVLKAERPGASMVGWVLLVYSWCLLSFPHLAKGVRALFGACFIRAWISIMRVPPSWSKYLPMVPPPNTTLGNKISTCVNLGEKQTLRPWQ